jgi:hypothetical protein
VLEQPKAADYLYYKEAQKTRQHFPNLLHSRLIIASLLALPIELLQHIALSLSFSAILKLQCVNSEFYEAYNDRLVMQSAARNGFYNTAGALDRLIDL